MKIIFCRQGCVGEQLFELELAAGQKHTYSFPMNLVEIVNASGEVIGSFGNVVWLHTADVNVRS